MSTHDSIIRYGQDRRWRARWQRLARRSLHSVMPWRLGSRPVRAGRRERHRLVVIEYALTAETPRLAAMFEMFSQLAAGESCEGAERLPWLTRQRPPRRPRARRVHVALLLAFASLVALCVTLSFRVNPGSRCPASTSSTSSASPGQSRSPVFRAAGAFAPVHTAGCHAYPTYSK